MTNNQSICRRAFSLASRQPQGAGLTLRLTGGPTEYVAPSIGTSGLEPLLMRAGVYRGEQRRFSTELRVYVEDRGEKISGYIERVTGVAFLETIPDPTEFVASFEGATWDEAEAACARALSEKLPDVTLYASTISYRHNKFGQATFNPERCSASAQGLRKLVFGAGSDTELNDFVSDVVTRALDWSPEGRKPRSISLWFTVNGECLKTIYTTIDMHSVAGKFVIDVSDKSIWPWREKALAATVSTKAEVVSRILGYIGKAHAFKLSSMEVYFNWSEAS